MTRLSRSSESDVRKGAWGPDEDEKLRKYVETYGSGQWRSVGERAGLQRCGKSCRLRWTNYLRPDIRHGSFTTEEEDLIIKLHAEHGSRWSLIASRLPGRTDNDIKNHWNTRVKKKLCDMGIDPVTHQPIADLLRTLAGGMATGSTGNQLAEEAARRCFRDNMLNKAVREFALTPPAGPSKNCFSTGTRGNIVDQRSGNPAIAEAQFHRHDDGVATANGFSESANVASSEAKSVGEYSSSSTEPASQILSDHSSPPLQRGLTHMGMGSILNVYPRCTTSYRSHLQESGGHSQGADGTAPQVVYLPYFNSQDPAPNPHGLLPNFHHDSDLAFRRSADCEVDAALGGRPSSGVFQAREAQLTLYGVPGPADPHPHPLPAHPQPRGYNISSRPGHNDNNSIILSHDRPKFENEIPNGFSPTVPAGLMHEPMPAAGNNNTQFEGLRFRSLDMHPDGTVPLLPEYAVIPRVSFWDYLIRD